MRLLIPVIILWLAQQGARAQQFGCHVRPNPQVGLLGPCAVGCLNLNLDHRVGCGKCTVDKLGGRVDGCYPGAKGWSPAPITPEDTAETAVSALIAGRTVCNALQAAVETHVKYFWKQQEAERTFVRSLPQLCAAPPAAYYARLHALRAPMGDAINRHVRGAFFVKAACTSAAYELAPGESEIHVCNPPILAHEPFNIGEGFFVVNLTNHLLRGGHAKLCAPGTNKRVARWQRGLEVVQKRHASNKAFDDMWTDIFQARCDALARARAPVVALYWRPSPSRLQFAKLHCDSGGGGGVDVAGNEGMLPATAAAARKHTSAVDTGTTVGVTCAEARAAAPPPAALARGIDAALRTPAECRCAGPGPCTPEAIVDVIEADTRALLEFSRHTVVAAHTHRKGACPGADARAPAIAALAEATRARRTPVEFSPSRTQAYTSFVLSSVYHKVVPFCGPETLGRVSTDEMVRDAARDRNGRLGCDGHSGSYASNAMTPVLDLIASTDATRCGATTPVPCAVAAGAIDRYHALLHRITAVRTRLLERIYGEGPAGDEGAKEHDAHGPPPCGARSPPRTCSYHGNMPVYILRDTFSDQTRCIAQLRPG